MMEAPELGHFLRTRRERLAPADVGLVSGNKRRTPGLRREEVAVLAGVGASWLTRLEQGHANRVSAEVLHGLASALRLSGTERAHLFALAGVHLPSSIDETALSDMNRRLVDGLDPNPAYLLDHHWNLAAWNRAEEELFPLLATAGPNPNLLRLFLEHAELRTSVEDWLTQIERLTHQFRAHITAHPSNTATALAADLKAAHPEFERAWERHDVAPLAPSTRVINTRSGPRRYEQHRLSLPDHPGWQLVLFLPLGAAHAVPAVG